MASKLVASVVKSRRSPDSVRVLQSFYISSALASEDPGTTSLFAIGLPGLATLPGIQRDGFSVSYIDTRIYP